MGSTTPQDIIRPPAPIHLVEVLHGGTSLEEVPNGLVRSAAPCIHSINRWSDVKLICFKFIKQIHFYDYFNNFFV